MLCSTLTVPANIKLTTESIRQANPIQMRTVHIAFSIYKYIY